MAKRPQVMSRRKSAEVEADQEENAGPVHRTRSITVLSVLAFILGLIMALGGLLLAESAVFVGGMLLAFLGLIAMAIVRFFALATNQQIAATHDEAKATQQALARMAPVNPRPQRARPATKEHLARAQRLVRCPRCRHQQPWTAGALVCDSCGLQQVEAQH